MAQSLARDAIAFMIDLAEKGEIDPWDVKVVDVIDRFLSELSPFTAVGRDNYANNLSQSGQAFLYASMLLLLKADSLTTPEPEPLTDDYLDDGLYDELPANVLPMNLDRSLRRRAVAQPPVRRRVTLKELINQLEVIASALEEDQPQRRKVRPKAQSRSQAVKVIAQLAHQENLTEMAVALEEFFVEYWTELSQGKEWIDFDLLVEFWKETKAAEFSDGQQLHGADPDTHERVGVFWALLLLASQSKVDLSQEEFYQDLRVRSLAAGLGEIDALAAIAVD
ncbi:segregation/condensation protein A [filamentous cyanobacterium LEGE 11480]|uniref:Segregation and condensation protein A n=1 Tax=Romeriopsis navalis LEGE 11480 TaxID=2777977 RepID=A0A928VKL7_9CYAN|nr:ScpA family protein [Romeriopsis navalis]MBE9029468.1 segregation/condensation protein A [Romeriopsis navalis LEGE 11480]